MIKRDLKRYTIGVVLFILSFVFFGSVFFLIYPEPSCFDGKRNQAEEAVDCGGPCEPCFEKISAEKLEIISLEWVKDVENRYDAVVNIKNPNDLYGLENFSVGFILKNEQGESVGKKTFEENFILPGETKKIVFQGILSEKDNPKKLEVFFDKEFDWKKINTNIDSKFIVNNKRFEKVENKSFKSSVKGEVINQSNVGFEEVFVQSALYDDKGKLLAVNSQIINSVKMNETRGFESLFFNDFPGKVSKLEVMVKTNVFKKGNILAY